MSEDPDDGLEIVCRWHGHTVHVYAVYSPATEDWTLLSFIDSGRTAGGVATTEVHAATTTTDLWGTLSQMLPQAVMDAENGR